MSSPDLRPIIHVVAGVVIDAKDRVLIAQRPEGKHLAGGWEFPGGKLEPGEERSAGLARELYEELGIAVSGAARPLMRVRHPYPTRHILLDVWVVRSYSGVPRGLDGQTLRWCTQEELAGANLLPADAPIVAALPLPERLTERRTAGYEVVDTPDERSAGLRGAYCTSAAEAVLAAKHVHFLVLREPLSADALSALCQAVEIPVYARGIDLADAWRHGASGVNAIPSESPS